MEFTVNTKEFLSALAFAGKAVSRNAITPIFECVLIECKDSGTLTITGNDSHTCIVRKTEMIDFDLEGQKSVKIAAPFEILLNTIKTFPDGPTHIEYTSDGNMEFRMNIMFETNRFSIDCQDASVYFKTPEVSGGESITIESRILKSGISSVIDMVSDDQLRPAMCGVQLALTPGKVTFAAVDGFVMGMYEINYDHQQEKSIVIPAKYAGLIAESIGYGSDDIKINLSDRFVRVFVGDWVAYGLLIDDRFPEFRNAIPSSFEHSARMSLDDLKQVLNRAKVFANQKAPVVELTFSENRLNVVARNMDKNMASDQDIAIESEIDMFRIGFNIKLLEKVLRNVSKVFEVKMNAHSRPMVVYPEVGEGEFAQYVVMPTMIADPVVPATV